MEEFVVRLGSNRCLVIQAAVRRAQGLMARRVSAERSLAAELIAERRAAAARE